MCSVGTFVNLGKFSGELLHKLIESDGFLIGFWGGREVSMEHSICTHISG